MRTNFTIFGGKLIRWLTLTTIFFLFAQQQALPCNDLNLSGTTTICSGSSTQINFNISPGGPLPWRIVYAINGVPQPEIANITQSSFSITTSTPGTYTGLTIFDANDCQGTIVGSPVVITLDPLPGNPGSISGDAIVCQGEAGVVYTVPVITNANSYEWTLQLSWPGQ